MWSLQREGFCEDVFFRQDPGDAGPTGRHKVAGVQEQRLEEVSESRTPSARAPKNVAVLALHVVSPSSLLSVQEAVVTLFQLRKYPTLAQDLHLLNDKLRQRPRYSVNIRYSVQNPLSRRFAVSCPGLRSVSLWESSTRYANSHPLPTVSLSLSLSLPPSLPPSSTRIRY